MSTKWLWQPTGIKFSRHMSKQTKRKAELREAKVRTVIPNTVPIVTTVPTCLFPRTSLPLITDSVLAFCYLIGVGAVLEDPTFTPARSTHLETPASLTGNLVWNPLTFCRTF